MREYNTPEIHAAEWSLSELAEVYSQPDCVGNEGANERCQPDYNSRSWYGGISTLPEATRLLTDGWTDGANRLTDLCRDVAPPVAKSRRRKPVWADEGNDLSTDKALAGEWDSAWRASRRVWSAGPSTVTLVTQWGGNAHCGSDALFWQGAAATVITDALESAGYRVRVICGTPLVRNSHPTHHNSRDGAILVTLKEENQPMRIDALASVACHAGVFRTYGFRAIEALPFRTTGTGAKPWSGRFTGALRAAGAWPDEAMVLGEVNSRTTCIEEIRRVIQLIAA